MKVLGAFTFTLCLCVVLGLPTPNVEDGNAPVATDTTTGKKKEPNQGTIAERTRLAHILFSTYDKRLNPDNVTLAMSINLLGFQVHEKKNVLESHVWLRNQWVDNRLQWDPKDFGGVDLIRFPSSELWQPDVTLYNSEDPVNMVHCWDSVALIYPDGKVVVVPPCKMFSRCSFNLTETPYEEQVCTFKFGSWSMDGSIFDLEFFNGTRTIDTSLLLDTSGFNVVATNARRNVHHYDCCSEPYLDITYDITIKRKQDVEPNY